MQAAEYAQMYEIEDSHWWYVGMRTTSLALLEDVAGPPNETGTTLDAGCGTGGVLVRLAGHGRPIGVDVAAVALGYCRQRGLQRLTQASVEGLPFKDQSFDLITCLDVLYHVQVTRDSLALRELFRVLKPAGWLLVQVPAFEALRGYHDLEVHTRHRYTAPELRMVLEAAGFQVIRLSYANTLLVPVVAVKRLAERRFPVAAWLGSDLMPVPGWLNAALRGVLALERLAMARVSLPVGLSLMAVACKS